MRIEFFMCFFAQRKPLSLPEHQILIKLPLSTVLLLIFSLSLIPQSLSNSVRWAIDDRRLLTPSPGLKDRSEFCLCCPSFA